MKKQILFFLGMLVAAGSYAQPDFKSTDMPNIGDRDTVMYLVYYPVTNQLDSETGNAYAWDFSYFPFSMYPNFITLDYYREKTHIVSAPFTNATIEEYVYDGTAGDVNLFSYSNDTLYVHRLGAVVSGLNLNPPLPSVVFPIPFNKSSVTSYKFRQGIYTTGERTTTTTYDGFGTLKMPGNRTYTNVFRIKKVEKDSSYIYHSAISNTSYIWYKQGGQVPLLRLAWSGSTNLYFVFGSKASNTASGRNEVNAGMNFNIYPNPSTGKFVISDDNNKPDRVEIYNILGVKVFQSNNPGEIDLTDSPKGIYFVNILKGAASYSRKIVLN